MGKSFLGYRILVVEDDPMDAVLIGDALRKAGAIVSMTYSIREAFQQLAQQKWSLAIVNYSLQENAMELCERLMRADVPFLISAHDVTLKGSASWGLRIRRPVDMQELMMAAEALL